MEENRNENEETEQVDFLSSLAAPKKNGAEETRKTESKEIKKEAKREDVKKIEDLTKLIIGSDERIVQKKRC